MFKRLLILVVCKLRGCIYNLQLDHLIPKAKGGTDTGDNLVIACQKCNGSNYPEAEYIECFMMPNENI